MTKKECADYREVVKRSGGFMPKDEIDPLSMTKQECADYREVVKRSGGFM
jgi:hypothetical protein